jgi:hypothetical protein
MDFKIAILIKEFNELELKLICLEALKLKLKFLSKGDNCYIYLFSNSNKAKDFCDRFFQYSSKGDCWCLHSFNYEKEIELFKEIEHFISLEEFKQYLQFYNKNVYIPSEQSFVLDFKKHYGKMF